MVATRRAATGSEHLISHQNVTKHGRVRVVVADMDIDSSSTIASSSIGSNKATSWYQKKRESSKLECHSRSRRVRIGRDR